MPGINLTPTVNPRARAIAQQILAESQQARPIYHPLQGVAQLAQALVQSRNLAKYDRQDARHRQELAQLLGQAQTPDIMSATQSLGSGPSSAGPESQMVPTQQQAMAALLSDPQTAPLAMQLMGRQDAQAQRQADIQRQAARQAIEDQRYADEVAFRNRQQSSLEADRAADNARADRQLNAAASAPPDAPTGYRWVGNSLQPIPGGPQDPNGPQNAQEAARRAAVEQAGSLIPQVRQLLFTDDGDFREWTAINPASEDGQRAHSMLLTAVEAVLRAESGAAVPPSEVERAAERFMPSPWLTDAANKQRLDLLQERIARVMSGYSGGERTDDGPRTNYGPRREAEAQPLGSIAELESIASGQPIPNVFTPRR